MTTVSKPSFSRMSTIICVGIVAAPVTDRRRRRQVERVEVGVVEDRLEDGGRPGQHRHPLLHHAAHHRRDVEDRVRDDRRPLDQAREDPGLQTERVEERVDDEVAVTLAQADHDDHASYARMLAEWNSIAPFGRAGRARREQDVAEVVGLTDGGARGDSAASAGDRLGARP